VLTDPATATPSSGQAASDFEAIIIGAGVCGIYQLIRLRQAGISATVLEAGGDLGGTWYWNRYPGARFDSESYTYAYSFSKELLQDWNWSELFAGRAETERYLRHVAERFDLRKDMQFGATVVAARWDESQRRWSVELADGRTLTSQFLLTAIGMLSTPTLPRYEGVDSFKGLSFHTYFAPREPVDYAGKRVAVIGTGATGVQTIAAIADQVAELTVFQRRPNWCAPLHNAPIAAAQMEEIKASYDDIFERCRTSPGGFIHAPDPRKTFEVPAAERLAFWEQLYASPGFGIWLGNFRDVLIDPDANAEFSQFIANKIRERVRDPAIAEKLIPQDHGFGSRRVPLETRYYEVYNRENVSLVDLGETPIERITPQGLRTSERDFAFDIIIYATGFDAITGAFDKIDLVGMDGLRLREKWAGVPRSAYGVMTRGFPNMVTLSGPQSASVATNFPRGIEEAVNWSTAMLLSLKARGGARVEPRQATEDAWAQHVKEIADRLLLSKERSWFTGYNSNLSREYENRYLIYAGGTVRYREHLQREVDCDYAGFEMS